MKKIMVIIVAIMSSAILTSMPAYGGNVGSNGGGGSISGPSPGSPGADATTNTQATANAAANVAAAAAAAALIANDNLINSLPTNPAAPTVIDSSICSLGPPTC